MQLCDLGNRIDHVDGTVYLALPDTAAIAVKWSGDNTEEVADLGRRYGLFEVGECEGTLYLLNDAWVDPERRHYSMMVDKGDYVVYLGRDKPAVLNWQNFRELFESEYDAP